MRATSCSLNRLSTPPDPPTVAKSAKATNTLRRSVNLAFPRTPLPETLVLATCLVASCGACDGRMVFRRIFERPGPCANPPQYLLDEMHRARRPRGRRKKPVASGLRPNALGRPTPHTPSGSLWGRCATERSSTKVITNQTSDQGALLEPLRLTIGLEPVELFRIKQDRDLALFLSVHAVTSWAQKRYRTECGDVNNNTANAALLRPHSPPAKRFVERPTRSTGQRPASPARSSAPPRRPTRRTGSAPGCPAQAA